MATNLDPVALKILRAIHDAGAKSGVPFATDMQTLTRGIDETDVDTELFIKTLGLLVSTNVSVKSGNITYTRPCLAGFEMNQDTEEVIVTVGAPLAMISPDIGN